MSDIAIYTAASGAVEVRLEKDTVWLRQEQLTELFGRDRTVIGRHISNIFKEGELEPDSVRANFAHTAADGKTYQVEHYTPRALAVVGSQKMIDLAGMGIISRPTGLGIASAIRKLRGNNTRHASPRKRTRAGFFVPEACR